MGFARLDIAQRDPMLFGPICELGTDIFRAAIDTDHGRPVAPFDDLIEASRDPLSRQRELHN